MRKHVGDFKVRLGPIVAEGPLYSVRLPASQDPEVKPKTHLLTPSGDRVVQRYIDPKGKEWEVSELERGVVAEDNAAQLVSKDDLAEAKQSELPGNILDLSVHPAETIHQVYPDDANGYVWYPDASEQKNVDFYNTIYAAVKYSDKVLLGACNLKGHEGLYTLDTWRGYIVIVKVLYPASLNEHAVRDSELPVAVRKHVLGLIDDMVEDFNPEQYHNQTAARVAEAIENSVISVTPGAKPKVKEKPKVVEHDLMASLAQMKALVNSGS